MMNDRSIHEVNKEAKKSKAETWDANARIVAEKVLGNPVSFLLGKLGWLAANVHDIGKSGLDKCCKSTSRNKKSI